MAELKFTGHNGRGYTLSYNENISEWYGTFFLNAKRAIVSNV